MGSGCPACSSPSPEPALPAPPIRGRTFSSIPITLSLWLSSAPPTNSGAHRLPGPWDVGVPGGDSGAWEHSAGNQWGLSPAGGGWSQVWRQKEDHNAPPLGHAQGRLSETGQSLELTPPWCPGGWFHSRDFLSVGDGQELCSPDFLRPSYLRAWTAPRFRGKKNLVLQESLVWRRLHNAGA